MTLQRTLMLVILLTTSIARAEVAEVVEISDPVGEPVLLAGGEPCHRYRTHAYIGGQLMGLGAVAQSALKTDRYLSRFGGGIGLFGGLRISPYVSLEGNWTFALHDEELPDLPQSGSHGIYIMTVTADLKAHLPTNSPIEPYLQLGGGLLMTGGIRLDDRQSDEPDSFATGATFTAGAGLDIWITRHLSMGARVLYRAMALGESREDRLQEHRFRNVIHGISVDAMASIHF